MNNLPIKLDLPEHFLEDEVREGYTISIKQKKIWAVELDLMDQLLRVCKKYNIKVIAFAGTILGAVRHKGFIPWDDDMDVALLREDYEKLLKVAPYEFKEPYFFQTAETDPAYFIGYARLRNSQTTGVVEVNKASNYNCGIYIDIFVLDGYSENKTLFNKNYRKKLICDKILNKYNVNQPHKNSTNKIASLFIHHTVCRVIPYDNMKKKYHSYLIKFNEKTERVSIVTQSLKFIKKYWCMKSDFKYIINVPFENLIIPIPANYDEVLKHMYGNYMKYPPVEERGLWHEGMLTFNPDIPYKEFFKRLENED